MLLSRLASHYKIHLLFLISVFTYTPSVAQNFIVERVIVIGNKVTKYNIISREFAFKEGDTLQKENLDQAIELTRQNLQNTSLFNFINIKFNIFNLSFFTLFD